jgi:hypothetical protein
VFLFFSRVIWIVAPFYKDIDDFQPQDPKKNLDELFVEDVVQGNVVVKDISATKFHDLLVLQAALPPDAVLENVHVEVSTNDPNSGTLSVDEDANFLEHAKSLKKSWKLQNSSLTNEIEGLLHLAWKQVLMV